MKIYKLTFNEHGYDEYDSFIVKANNKEEVVTLVKEIVDRNTGHNTAYSLVRWEKGYIIKEIGTLMRECDCCVDKSEVLLGSFNAG